MFEIKPNEFSMFTLLVALAGTLVLMTSVAMTWYSGYTSHSSFVLHGVGIFCWIYATIAVVDSGHI